VARASVSVDDEELAHAGHGLVVLLGIGEQDTEEDARYIVEKTLNLRIFGDRVRSFEVSALDTKAEVLVISQFTLYARTRKGRRPDFTEAAPPQQAESLYHRTVELFAASGLRVVEGRFGAYMQVSLVNDGPVTILLDSQERNQSRRD
jgi:D-tyrosyl-tRNA(Tyr) deacylase